MNRTWIVVGLLAVSTGCSAASSGPKQPAVSAFAEGTCRTAAPDVLTVGKQVRKLGTSSTPAAGPLDAMTAAQQRLDVVASAAEPAYQSALRKLVTTVGLVRLRAHTGSYAPSLGQDVISAYDVVVRVCTRSQ